MNDCWSAINFHDGIFNYLPCVVVRLCSDTYRPSCGCRNEAGSEVGVVGVISCVLLLVRKDSPLDADPVFLFIIAPNSENLRH
jgi:hypothetical protein